MSKKLIIFGVDDTAELAHFYFNSDSIYKVECFTLDSGFIGQRTQFCGLPLIPFDQVEALYPPQSYAMFIALGYSKLNFLRKEKYLLAKSMGYNMASYLSSYARILNQGSVGENCFILEDNTIQPFVKIGNNVTLWSGNHIGHHSLIDDHTFIASHVVISGRVHIGQQCFIGVNATLRDHITVGDRCVIGAGALLLADAAPDGVYIGSAPERSRVPSSKLRKI